MHLTQLLNEGGATLYVLLACSVIVWAVIIERLGCFRAASRVPRAAFMARLGRELEAGNIQKALALCDETGTAAARVARAGIVLRGADGALVSNAMERAVTVETVKLERYTGIVGTIGSTSVYIGLFGTVLGIIKAFRDIAASASNTTGMSVVVNGIAEALICTAAGLCVAVPAVMAYNYFTRRIDVLVTDMELCASEVTDVLHQDRER